MAVSLKPCPVCQRPMESKRSVCVFCQQQGLTPDAAPSPAHAEPPPHTTAAPAPSAPAHYAPAASQGPQISTLGGVFILLAMIVGSWIFFGGGALTGLSSTPSATPAVATGPRQMLYRVTGNGTSSASLTYQNAQGGTEQAEVPLPWELPIAFEPGEFAYLSAQNGEEQGNITVEILIAGRVWKTSTSQGGHTIATASDNVPEGMF